MFMLTVIRQAYISRQQSLIFLRDQVKEGSLCLCRGSQFNKRKEVYATVGVVNSTKEQTIHLLFIKKRLPVKAQFSSTFFFFFFL